MVDFIPDIHLEDVKHILFQHKDQLAVWFLSSTLIFQFYIRCYLASD